MAAVGRASLPGLLPLLLLASSLAPFAHAIQRNAATSPPPKKPPPPPPVAGTFKPATERALLDFAAHVSATINYLKLKTFFSWRAGNPCKNWAYLTCNSATGDVLNMTLRSKSLEGIIPDSFYTITTFVRIDLRDNRLYGLVNEGIANINPNLVYLDLSSNFFGGQVPDLWRNSAPDSNFHLFIYFNVSNTYFSGFSTVKGADSGFYCIGTDFPGSYNNTCINCIQDSSNWGIVSGHCPACADVYRGNDACHAWCGTNTALQQCSSRGICVPKFASSYRNVVVSKSCQYFTAPPKSPAPPPPPPVAQAPAQLSVLLQIKTALGNPVALASWKAGALCTALLRVGCDASRNVISLDLSNLGIRRPIPSAIGSLTTLKTLSLSRNRFYGNTSAINGLPSLERLDLSSNYLSGPIPSGLSSSLNYLNVANNFFSGVPTVQLSNNNIFCKPYLGSSVANNCFTFGLNFPCDVKPQRPAANCTAFCGIKTSVPIVGACQGGAAGTCVPAVTTAAYGTAVAGTCTGTAPTPTPWTLPPYPSAQQWEFWASQNPFTGSYTWDHTKPCSTWTGVKCGPDGYITDINLSGKGLKGLMPGTSATDKDYFWTGTGASTRLTLVDFSRNFLYGPIPSAVPNSPNIISLDLSSNYFTGPLPSSWAANFEYFNVSSNYLYGSPAIYGADYVSTFCPGSISLAGSEDANCFDVAYPKYYPCAYPAPKPALASPSCKSFCGGVSTRSGVCSNNGTYCQPTTFGAAPVFKCKATVLV